MIPLRCLLAKSNNRTCDQLEYGMTWLCFCFDLVRSHARHGNCSIVCLRFQVVQIKQADCKMSTINVNNYDTFGELHTQEYKATKKQIVSLQPNEKKSKERQKRLIC